MNFEPVSKDSFELSAPLNDIPVTASSDSSLNVKNKYTLVPKTQDSKEGVKIPVEHNKKYKNSNFSSLSIFSRVFFTWVLTAVKISNKTSLKPHHLLENLRLAITRNDLAFLRTIWFGDPDKNLKGYNTLSFCPLLLAIMRANFLSLFLLFSATFANTGCKFVQIYFLRQLILVFKHLKDPTSTEPKFSLISSVLFFLSAKVVYIIVNYQIKYLEDMIGRKTSNQISSLIYEKTMQTSTSSLGAYSEGEVMNYIQVDSDSLGMFFYYFPKTVVFPFQFSMYLYMLFSFFGWSFLFGFATFVTLMLVSFFVQYLYIRNQFDYLKKKDNRMKMTSQTFHKLKVLKLYGWEDRFEELINGKREIELGSMKKILNLNVVSQFIHWSIPLVVSIISVGVFTYRTGGVMNIADLMTSIDIFDSMSGPLYRLPIFITSVLNAFISMNRISKFLKVESEEKQYKSSEKVDKSIKIKNISFGNQKSNKILVEDVNIEINKGELVAVIGETGSGKTCLINSIMGLMDLMGSKKLEDNFIINGSFSLAAQIPWIMNETIRNNITLYNDFDQEKYKKVIQLCQLEKDISDLPGGDLTEIGANGANISGGQKARISLARSVYANADIYLLDDPISSVDSYVSMEIFNKLFYDYLKDKTRIIVTNDLRNLHKFDKILFIEKGKIIYFGEHKDILDKEFYKEFIASGSSLDHTSNSTNTSMSSSDTLASDNEINLDKNYTESQLKKAKLTKDEDQEKGRVGLKIYNKFLKYIGGYCFALSLVIFAIAWQLAKVLGNVWLTNWTEATDPDNLYYFLMYTQIGFLSIFFQFLKDFLVSRANLNMSRKLHNIMLHPLIKAPVNLFHDTVPIGQILNRLSHDLEKSKDILKICASFLKSTCTLIGAIVVCCRFNIYCLFLSPILIGLGIWVANYYVNAGRDLNRLNGIGRSPILTLYSETISGIGTIKAFKSEEKFKELFFDRLDDYYSIVNYKFGAETWFCMNLELLSVVYMVFILIYAIIFKHFFTAQAIGLLIKYAVSFSEEMLGVIDYIIEIEQALISIERCEGYSKIPQEKADTIKGIDPRLEKNGWPNEGAITITNLNLRYRPEIDLTLKNININIKPREKIGIVGRTGSGKSTLSLALFRLVESETGKIEIDEVDINKIGLKLLRKSLTIVPQDPTLFEGNLRFNLDPLHQYKDSVILDSVKEVGLFTLMQDNGRDISRGLELKIKDNGDNLSLGEKQLICFARALLRKSNIILLDEATASVDHKTERSIQDALEKIFKGKTLITIAHRIQTVEKCDRVIVMSNGEVAEFDSPENLIKKDGVFKKLYNKNNSVK